MENQLRKTPYTLTHCVILAWALSASSMSSTEPLFFILCSCKKSRQRTNHHHPYQQQKNHYLSSCVPCQKARHWSQIRGNTCQSQVVTEQYVSWAYTNIQTNSVPPKVNFIYQLNFGESNAYSISGVNIKFEGH